MRAIGSTQPLHACWPPLKQVGLPMGVRSSIWPSQSSSMPLHTSAPAGPGVQLCVPPPTQFCTVRRQAPVPQKVFIIHPQFFEVLNAAKGKPAADVHGFFE